MRIGVYLFECSTHTHATAANININIYMTELPDSVFPLHSCTVHFSPVFAHEMHAHRFSDRFQSIGPFDICISYSSI